jgi:hypothetical protein
LRIIGSLKSTEQEYGIDRFELFKFLADFLFLHMFIETFEVSFKKKRKIIIEKDVNPMREGVGALGTAANAKFYVDNMMDILAVGRNVSRKNSIV